MSAETAALMVLRACGVSATQFQQLTAPLQHRLPTTEVELATLTHHLRRMGHVLEHRPGNIASTLGGVAGSRQNFFGETPDAEADPTAWWESVWGIGEESGSGGTSLNREVTSDVTPAEQNAFHSQ